MKKAKRVFLIVLDSFGIGEAPDSAKFGDKGCSTIKSVSSCENLKIPNLLNLGFSNIDGITFFEKGELKAQVARLKEKSAGKDTTIGHWEIAGVVSKNALPTFPDGLPDGFIREFSDITGRGILCNRAYSGTQVIKDFGAEHLKTGNLICYTSADSVFQIAAHEDIVPTDLLYEYCREARRLLTNDLGVGRVIARPFTGKYPFKRTSARHDFSLEQPDETLLDNLKNDGFDVIGVGKINDIFAGRGITEFVYTADNRDGMAKTTQYQNKNFNGLCFVNLVDFDMLFGHRRDCSGYAAALSEFDFWLGDFITDMRDDDALIITADHGCDPNFSGTDHTREYVPYILCGKNISPKNLGTVEGFTLVCDTVKKLLKG